MASLVLKPMIPNLDLIPDLTAVSAFPRNVTLIHYSGTFWSALMRSSVQWNPSMPQRKKRHLSV